MNQRIRPLPPFARLVLSWCCSGRTHSAHISLLTLSKLFDTEKAEEENRDQWPANVVTY